MIRPSRKKKLMIDATSVHYDLGRRTAPIGRLLLIGHFTASNHGTPFENKHDLVPGGTNEGS